MKMFSVAGVEKVRQLGQLNLLEDSCYFRGAGTLKTLPSFQSVKASQADTVVDSCLPPSLASLLG